MSIDKSIRQYYSRGQLVQPGPGRPGYQGQGPAGGSHESYGGSSSPYGGGGDGSGRELAAQKAAQKAAEAARAAAQRPSIMDKDPEETKREVKALKDKVKRYTTQDFKAKDYVDLDKYMRDKDLYPDEEKYTAPIVHPEFDTEETQAAQKITDELNRRNEIRDMIAKQQEEKYGSLADPTKFGETVDDLAFRNHPEARAKEAEEAIKQLSTPEGTKEALREFKALETGRQYVPDVNLLEKLGIKKPEDIKKSFADTGKIYLENYAKKAATNFALKKLGLGAFIPWLGIASLFFPGKKDAFMSKFPKRKGTAIEPVAWQGGDDRVSEDVVTASVKKFKPTKSQEDQIAEINRKRLILLEYARTGRLNETGQNTLAQFDKLLKQYETSPETLWT